jgi:hypothetical protein
MYKYPKGKTQIRGEAGAVSDITTIANIYIYIYIFIHTVYHASYGPIYYYINIII